MGIVARKINYRSASNLYVREVALLELDKAIEDVFVSKYTLEELEEYDDYDLVVIEALERTFVSILPNMRDTPDIAFINKDGSVWVASQGFADPDLDNGTYYAGDEIDQIGQGEPYDTDASWLWGTQRGISQINRFPLSSETLDKILEKYNDK